jgi:hypothetical protein
MGLLDDAIRDHLDLKRRRGADPAEIERAEREALGPVRREPIGSEDEPQLTSSPAESPAMTGDETVLHPIVEEYGPGEDFNDEPDEGEGLDEDERWDDYDDEYEDEEEARAQPADAAPHRPSPRPPSEETRPPADPAGGLGETVSYDVDEALSKHSGEGEDDDVLEETPEFLQDTPDHDRLWFEQRPPKDFDFDE